MGNDNDTSCTTNDTTDATATEMLKAKATAEITAIKERLAKQEAAVRRFDGARRRISEAQQRIEAARAEQDEALFELRALGIASTEIGQLLGLDARRVRAKTPRHQPHAASNSKTAPETQARPAQPPRTPRRHDTRTPGACIVMGRDHAALGALVALGAAHIAALEPAVALAAATTVAGSALLPDIDEPGSSVAHLAEPLTEVVAWVTKRVAGGHRCATHSLLAVAVSVVVAWLLLHLSLVRGVPAAVILVGLAYAICARSLIPRLLRPGHVVALVAAAAATWATWRYAGVGWTLWAVPLGVGLHLVGDVVTSSGVPLLWPHKAHYALPVLGHTSSLTESVAGFFMLGLVVVLAWAPAAAVIAIIATPRGALP